MWVCLSVSGRGSWKSHEGRCGLAYVSYCRVHDIVQQNTQCSCWGNNVDKSQTAQCGKGALILKQRTQFEQVETFSIKMQIRNLFLCFLQGFDRNKLACQFNGTNARILGIPALTPEGDYQMNCRSVPVSYKKVVHQWVKPFVFCIIFFQRLHSVYRLTLYFTDELLRGHAIQVCKSGCCRWIWSYTWQSYKYAKWVHIISRFQNCPYNWRIV